MGIIYKDIHDFYRSELQDLFLSVNWSSGHFPDKLVIAMQNFETVYSAWDTDKLIGPARPRAAGRPNRSAPSCP